MAKDQISPFIKSDWKKGFLQKHYQHNFISHQFNFRLFPVDFFTSKKKLSHAILHTHTLALKLYFSQFYFELKIISLKNSQFTFK